MCQFLMGFLTCQQQLRLPQWVIFKEEVYVRIKEKAEFSATSIRILSFFFFNSDFRMNHLQPNGMRLVPGVLFEIRQQRSVVEDLCIAPALPYLHNKFTNHSVRYTPYNSSVLSNGHRKNSTSFHYIPMMVPKEQYLLKS